MEAEQIKKLYQAMSDSGFSSLELELGDADRVRIVLDNQHAGLPTDILTDLALVEDDEPETGTQVEIRSDKVGTFSFAGRTLQAGDRIKKGEVLGVVKGISFQDRIKCSLDGVIRQVEVAEGAMVDYGRLLFLVSID